eukprot:30962-Pelagococcus_subviridis.AAC.18
MNDAIAWSYRSSPPPPPLPTSTSLCAVTLVNGFASVGAAAAATNSRVRRISSHRPKYSFNPTLDVITSNTACASTCPLSTSHARQHPRSTDASPATCGDPPWSAPPRAKSASIGRCAAGARNAFTASAQPCSHEMSMRRSTAWRISASLRAAAVSAIFSAEKYPPMAPPTPIPIPIPIPASDDDARTAADRYRTMRGSSSSGGDAADVGSSSGMVKIFALAAAFPSSMCLSTAAAWHDTESSPGPPAAPVVFPTSALARNPPKDTSPSPTPTPVGAIVEMHISWSSVFPRRTRAKTPSAAARSAASFPRVAARRHDSNAGSCFPAPRFTSAANRRSWHDRFSATRSPKHRSAKTRTGTLGTASSPRHKDKSASSVPNFASCVWFSARHRVFAVASLCAISSATASSTPPGVGFVVPAFAPDVDTSNVTSSSAQSKLAAFCGGGGGPPGVGGGVLSCRISGSF